MPVGGGGGGYGGGDAGGVGGAEHVTGPDSPVVSAFLGGIADHAVSEEQAAGIYDAHEQAE